jgi:hypothetical protein
MIPGPWIDRLLKKHPVLLNLIDWAHTYHNGEKSWKQNVKIKDHPGGVY